MGYAGWNLHALIEEETRIFSAHGYYLPNSTWGLYSNYLYRRDPYTSSSFLSNSLRYAPSSRWSFVLTHQLWDAQERHSLVHAGAYYTTKNYDLFVRAENIGGDPRYDSNHYDTPFYTESNPYALYRIGGKWRF